MKKTFSKPNYYDFSIYRSEIMGIATLMILVFHLTSYTNTSKLFGESLLYYLNLGVELFLLVSGIGLYFSLSNSGFRYRNYMTKRVLNVYVPATLINAPYFIYSFFTEKNRSVFALILNIVGISYWYTDSLVGWYVYWAMIFYLIYPLIFRFLSRHNDTGNIIGLIVSGTFVVASCLVLEKLVPSTYNYVETGLTRIVVFLVGCYIGKLVYEKKQIKPVAISVMACGAFFCIFIKSNAFQNVANYFSPVNSLLSTFHLNNCHFSFSVIRISGALIAPFLALILTTIFKLFNIQLINSLLKFLGKISLEVYLIHIVLAKIFLSVTKQEFMPFWQYALVIAVSIPLSYLVSKMRKALVANYTKKLLSAPLKCE